MVAGLFDLDDGVVRAARIAVGSCSAVAQRLERLEATLVGKRPDAALVELVHLDHLTPLEDVRASAAYRNAAALQIVRDLVARAASSARRAA